MRVLFSFVGDASSASGGGRTSLLSTAQQSKKFKIIGDTGSDSLCKLDKLIVFYLMIFCVIEYHIDDEEATTTAIFSLTHSE